MSILVKGIKMPKDCPYCPMANWSAVSRFVGCNAVPSKRYIPNTDRDFWDSSTRPDWCPLVELKDWSASCENCKNKGTDVCESENAKEYGFCGNWTMKEGEAE